MTKKNDGRLFGLHIYQDDKGRYVFYNIFNKKAYLITAADDIKKYTVYQTRLAMAILVGFIVLNFLEMPILGVALGIGLYVVLTIMFYRKFIANLATAKNFDIKAQPSFLMRFAGPLSYTRLRVAAVLLVVMSVLIIYNVKISDFDQLTATLNYVMSACAIVAAVVMVYAYFVKKRNDKGGKKR